jgi:hypothetical protein
MAKANQLSKGIVQAYKFIATGGGIKLGSSTLGGIVEGTFNADPPSIAGGANGSVAVTLAGVAATDIVVLEPPATLEAGLQYRGVNVTANTITILLSNSSGAPVDGASKAWAYKIIKVS